jgi:polyhydroxyalkanoate synthesis regulator phasin
METKEKEALRQEAERLKAAYKKEKAKLEWVENDYEEWLITQEMASLKNRIKGIRRELEAMEEGDETV